MEDEMITILNEFTLEIAKDQIREAFRQSQKEVQDLHQRTSEGMLTAKLNGKQIGGVVGSKYKVKKSIVNKSKIFKVVSGRVEE